jgi:uncharacterized protein
MATRSRTVDIPVAGKHIDGTLVASDTMVPGVLLVHGWDGSQAQYIARAHEIAALGCVCMTFDLRGHERHLAQRETVSREDNLQDVLAAYDVLVAHPSVDPGAIVLVGSSYGGYLAAVATMLRPVRWLALRVPALYRDHDWHVPKRQLPRDDLMALRHSVVEPQDNRALKACATFKGDALVVESENDPVVPHPTIQNYITALEHARSLTYRMIPEADHGLTDKKWQQGYTALLVNWINEMLLSARTGQVEPPAEEPLATPAEQALGEED